MGASVRWVGCCWGEVPVVVVGILLQHTDLASLQHRTTTNTSMHSAAVVALVMLLQKQVMFLLKN